LRELKFRTDAIRGTAVTENLGQRGIEGTTVIWDRGARGIEKTVISNSGTLREL